MTSALAVVLGALISGLVGVLVVFYQQKLAGRHEIDAARVARLSEFSAAGWTATLLISELARAPIPQKSNVEGAARYQDQNDRYNLAPAQIQLLDTGDVYRVAHRVDSCLVALERDAMSAQFDRDSWGERRGQLSSAVAEYQRAARVALGSPAIAGPDPWLERALAQQHASTDGDPAAAACRRA